MVTQRLQWPQMLMELGSLVRVAQRLLPLLVIPVAITCLPIINYSLLTIHCWERLKAGGEGEKGTTEDEMVGWHQRLNGHESE